MKVMKLLILSCGLLILSGCGSSQSNKENQSALSQLSNLQGSVVFEKERDVANFPEYIEVLKQYARNNGINEQTITIAFDGVYHIDRVVAADKNQPEKKATLDEYLSRAVSPARIALAKQKYLQYHDQLGHATLLTNVPQTYILSLWGTESAYGKYQGKEDVISALSTLAFDGRREQFFAKELIAALKILQNGHLSKEKFKGSWAGAMGQSQFMPSSYLTYGLDGDGDGTIDIWNSLPDIFASIGNYLATEGWNAKQGWGNKIDLPKGFNVNSAGLTSEKAKTVSEWLKTGIKFTDNKAKPSLNTKAWVIIPDDGSQQGYLVYNNFKTLMHWNRSYYFVISVGMLADSLTETPLNINDGK